MAKQIPLEQAKPMHLIRTLPKQEGMQVLKDNWHLFWVEPLTPGNLESIYRQIMNPRLLPIPLPGFHEEYPTIAKHVPISKAKPLHLMQTLPKEQGLDVLRENWHLFSSKEPTPLNLDVVYTRHCRRPRSL